MPGDKPGDNAEGAAGPEALQAKTTSNSRSLPPAEDRPAGWPGHQRGLRGAQALAGPSCSSLPAARHSSRRKPAGVPGEE